MLLVQEYLNSGKSLEDLKSDYAIKFNITGDLVVLNYDQIESPKTEPIVIECRSLILENKTWKLVSRAFDRFFNHGECLNVLPNQELSNFSVLEKIDGSIIQLFNYNNEWIMTTRSTINGTGSVSSFSNMTFKDLFYSTVDLYPNFFMNLNENYTYVFELVSPLNRVIKHYHKKELYLIGLRDFSNGGVELNYDRIVEVAGLLGVNFPKKYESRDIKGLIDLTKTLATLDEGFVCVDYRNRYDSFNFRRIKVKNPSYLAVAHLKESSASSMKGLMALVLTNDVDEFIGYFPEYKSSIEKIQEKYNEYLEEVNRDIDSVKSILEMEINPANRKEFALKVESARNKSFMFSLYSRKVENHSDWLSDQISHKGSSNVSKSFLSILNIKDIEFDI